MRKRYLVYATSPKANIWHLESRYFLKGFNTLKSAVKLAEKFGNCFVYENNIEILYSLSVQ